MDDKHCITIEGKVVVGRQPRCHRAGVRTGLAHNGTRPEQPSLASVGGGMAAGAAFASRTPSTLERPTLGCRVRPIFFCADGVTQMSPEL